MKKAEKIPRDNTREQLDRDKDAGTELRRLCLLYLFTMQQNIKACPADSESIHRFRVAGKRLRALCHLIQVQYPKSSNKLSRTVADCCRLLSGSRDQQVQYLLLSGLYPDAPERVQPEIRSWLQQHEMIQVKISQCDQKTMTRITHLLNKWIKRFECWQPKQIAWSPLLYRWQITRTKDLELTMQYIKHSPIDLHDWRKVSKRHQYQSELLGLETLASLKQLKQRNHLLGEWHDLDVLQHNFSGQLGDYLVKIQREKEQELLSQVLTAEKLL